MWALSTCITRDVVCGPPVEESKGSVLILNSKNVVAMEITVKVSKTYFKLVADQQQRVVLLCLGTSF